MTSIKKILTDIFCSSDGRVVYEKIGVVLAHAVSSYIVLTMANNGTLGSEIFISYLMFAAGHASFSKYQTLKYKQQNASNNSETAL